MEGSRYLRINPQKCEQHLSSFGKKVLYVLLQQDMDRKQRNTTYESRSRSPVKKILNFNNNSLPCVDAAIPMIHMLPPPIQLYETRAPLNLNITDSIQTEIHTSRQLIQTLDILHERNNNINDDFVHPTIVSRNLDHKPKQAAFVNERDQIPHVNVSNIFESADEIEPTDVNWDNMFDSEFFGADTENDNINTKINISDDLVGKISKTNASDRIVNEECNVKGVKKRKNIIKPVLAQNIKKAKKQNNTRDEIPKSLKKIRQDVLIHSFRKQKYTKTVKNWLDSVEPCNPIENIDMENMSNKITDIEHGKVNIAETQSAQSTANNKLKITFEKSTKSSKKVVQAQLANKDGIMKYSKPKEKETVETSNETSETKVVKDKKDKKTKKFVPPIISQTPVKDVTYDISTVDDSTVNEYVEKIEFEYEAEIMAVLIYGNGFCQLNSHFTEDTCLPDSLLLSTGDVFYCFNGTHQMLKETLAHVLENSTVISYEAQNIVNYLATRYQMKINTVKMYDVKIGASLLDPDNPPDNFSDLQKQLSCTAPYKIATECPQQKASWYSTLLKNCWVQLKEKLVENQLWHVFVDIEMKLLPIIAEMERRGVLIDLSKLKSMEEILVTRMKLIEQKCYKAAGKVFQINSTVQVRTILYDELELDSKCNVKIRETLSGGLKSTSETMLRSLISVHELPKLILEYRHLHKAHATFLAGIAQHVKGNLVRPTWLQTAAATGRIASSNPNLQAIPKVPFDLIMFPDEDDTTRVQLKFRSLYVSGAGRRLLAADFKHVECRVFAHAANDAALAQALAAPDLFQVLAARWLSKSEESVTPAERERTKRLVYASLYGAGTRKLMEILDVSYEQALQVAASFNRTFPSLKSFGRQVVAKCCQSGARLTTLCGRVRHFNNINSTDFNLKSHAERQAINFVVQGSAADLCKLAMVQTEEQLRGSSPAVEARLLLQIHDELVWDVARDHVPAAAAIIKRVMEGCGAQCGMSAPLPVAISVGDNWADMAPYAPPT